MFEEFYGLARTPFTRGIPADQLYVSITLEETLSRLEYAAERQLFGQFSEVNLLLLSMWDL
jgi:hypothetical protein